MKTFGAGNGGWTNKLIFGDNLQILKALMDDPEVYDKNTGKGKLRLIYIDPPFATRQEFRGSQDQKAYQDWIGRKGIMLNHYWMRYSGITISIMS